MNIAHILPASVVFPLSTHNGRYEWVLQLTSLQAKAGHSVTIYCNQNSHVDGVRIAGGSFSSDDKQRNNKEIFRLALQNNHDIYHSHFDSLHYEMAHETTKQIVYTQHWWPNEDTIRLAQANLSKNVWAVPPTSYMHRFDVQSNIQSKGFIYHGIDLTLFRPTKTPKSSRLLFVSRISPEKNLNIAITTAQKAGVGLDIIGKIVPKNQKYWDELESLIDGKQIKYLGTKNHEELSHYYTAARALIFPSDVNEPFGLVAIEAQACGTPVIMKKGGSRGELLLEGKTGFLCETLDDFANAASKVGDLKSTDCVDFANKFDVLTTMKRYEELYDSLVVR